MATLRLDQRRVDRLRPRKSTYDVRDRDLKGFGVRVLPSGAKRYFVHSQFNGRRVWKIVGEAEAIGVNEARARARTLLAEIREGGGEQAAAPSDTAFETVGEEVFRRYARNRKASTLKVNRNYYRNHILPWFEGRPIGDITAHDVRHTFASRAVLQGIPLPVVSRLLGHRQPSMTLRYAHVGDRETETAAERIGAAIARALDGSAAGSNG